METLRISGGKILYGDVSIQGAKNSALPLLAAVLLFPGRSIIKNCPRISDVDAAVRILECIGCTVVREEAGSTLIVDASSPSRYEIPDELMGEMRSSVIFLGALLARMRRAMIRYPGGCELGVRPIDLHLAAMRTLGVEVCEDGGTISCSAGKMIGKDIDLSFPSVGATENIMLAAVASAGVTRIINAAREPEIIDLQEYLRAIGAEINGAGGSVIEITGGLRPQNTDEVEFTVMPDRIVTATYMCAVAATGGRVLIRNCVPQHVTPIITLLNECGCKLRMSQREIDIVSHGRLHAMHPVKTMPYPGFPTDAQAVMMSVATRCQGTTLFVETIFQNRYRHVSELARMGADIHVAERCAVVTGVTKLSGARVEATDLRGGAAMAVAGLGAEGITEINGAWHVRRGYEDIVRDLSGLGADVEAL